MQRLSNFFVTVMQRYLPDAWVFAIILTLIVFVMGIALTPAGPAQMVSYWGNGFFGLLAFSMQMVLVLVTGYVLASTQPVRRLLRLVAKSAGTAPRAIILTTVVAGIASWINWGFGLIVGALLAKEMARQVKGLDYRLIIASAYSGFLVWHAGLSSSVALTIATPGHFLEAAAGVIPTAQTLFTPQTLLITLLLLIALPAANRMMLPPAEARFIADPALLAEPEPQAAAEADTPAKWLEHTPWLPWLIGAGGVIYLLSYFAGGGTLTLNSVIFIFLIAGVILHGTPRNYLNALQEAVGGTSGIILQFPFYAGIIGMMTDSGLAAIIAGWFVSISTAATLPFWTFISAGIVNFFVPSGGGQWAVQGPIVIEAASQLNAELSRVAMGVAWGDAWTNMVQPFWLLPALGIAGLQARDVMGYCVMALLVSGVIIGAGLLIL